MLAKFPHTTIYSTPSSTLKIEKLKFDIQNSGDDRFLRFTVNSGGCSGYQYEFKMDTKVDPENDILFEQSDARLIIDKLSLEFLEDCEIDYVTEMIRSSFQVTKNKLADASCGCGASFSVMSEF